MALRHDKRLRTHLSDEEITRLAGLLDKLQAGVEADSAEKRTGVAPAARGDVP